MSKLNKPLCATEYGNTGFGDCFLEPSKIIGVIQVPSTFQIAEANLADLQTYLETAVHAAPGSRLYPYHNFISVADNTEDVTINTTDYGSKLFIRDGYYDFTFRYLRGGVLAHNEFAKNEGTGKYFMFYDDNGVLYGYKSGGALKGIPCELFKVLPWRFPSGADAAQYLMRFIINPIYMNKGNLGFVKVTNFNLFDVQGLQDVSLELVSIASNVAIVKAYSKISAVDMYDAYSTNIAATAAWQAVNELGATCAITTVTTNSTEKGWNVTLNAGTFNASDKIYLKWAEASVLKAAPILVEGFDTSTALEIEAPAS
jgi:hypothetical protein